ncbi:hypothetical protein O9G_004656 [Rozella allomycis CSF55]|uniref:Uncharacterized protein n=1 Tax=Rozella allomycis (strain CSF55) TaxID=988480 RepID=A0A075AYV4_ROZAC|nr:hypothetical protein O9G_004656 [Rozella allomycis CSF55]|eukprot:EPZ35452.1 hypothetical protein O9G_004656 [Rozella allomycis CSF55]
MRQASPDNKNQQNKEPQVAARWNGPGPAAYTLPSAIGESPVWKRAPAVSVAGRWKALKNLADSTPGPNSFFPRTTRIGSVRGPAFSIQGRVKNNFDEKNENPGPSNYYPILRFAKSAPPAFTISGRSTVTHLSTNPGPSQYNIPSSIGGDQFFVKNASPKFTMAPNRGQKSGNNPSPGPAAYSANEVRVNKPSIPAYSLSGRYVKDYVNEVPGPNLYMPKIGFTHPATPRFSFRSKHSPYMAFVPDAENGDHLDFN